MKKTVIVLVWLAILAAGSAWATPLTLTISSDGLTPIEVVSEGIVGLDPSEGNFVSYGGSVGNGWFINMPNGFTGALLGDGLPQMLLSSVNVYNTGIGTGNLIISLRGKTGQWPALGALAGVFGSSSVGGTATFTTLIKGEVVSTMSFTGEHAAFEATDRILAVAGSDDIVELIATIIPAKSGVISFDYRLTPIPEASTIMLFGLGFLGLAIYSKRRNNA